MDWRIFLRKKVILDTNCKERLGMANKIGIYLHEYKNLKK